MAATGAWAPDETGYELFKLLRGARGTLPCLDQHLPGQFLSPGHAVVLHGEAVDEGLRASFKAWEKDRMS